MFSNHHTPRPWYRSRLFWLGWLPIIFLAWLWWDSLLYNNEFSFVRNGSSNQYCAVYSRMGRLTFDVVHIPSQGSSKSGLPHFHFERWDSTQSDLVDMNLGYHVSHAHIFNSGPVTTNYTLNLHYYLIVATAILVWLIACIWWQRRKRRLLQSPEVMIEE